MHAEHEAQDGPWGRANFLKEVGKNWKNIFIRSALSAFIASSGQFSLRYRLQGEADRKIISYNCQEYYYILISRLQEVNRTDAVIKKKKTKGSQHN